MLLLRGKFYYRGVYYATIFMEIHVSSGIFNEFERVWDALNDKTKMFGSGVQMRIPGDFLSVCMRGARAVTMDFIL